MEHTVVGVAAKPVDAQRIIDELVERCLCDRKDISVLAGGQAGNSSAQAVAGTAASAAGKTVGAILESVGMVVSRPLSGSGMLNAAGHLAGTLSRTALNSVTELTRVFAELGLEGDVAARHADALQRGEIVILVHAKTERMAGCARQVLATHGATAPERATQ